MSDKTPQHAKAYKVYFNDVITVTFAKTRSKAQYATLKAANDAGYDYHFLDMSRQMHCVRASEFDQLKLKEGRCYDPIYLRTRELFRNPKSKV